MCVCVFFFLFFLSYFEHQFSALIPFLLPQHCHTHKGHIIIMKGVHRFLLLFQLCICVCVEREKSKDKTRGGDTHNPTNLHIHMRPLLLERMGAHTHTHEVTTQRGETRELQKGDHGRDSPQAIGACCVADVADILIYFLVEGREGLRSVEAVCVCVGGWLRMCVGVRRKVLKVEVMQYIHPPMSHNNSLYPQTRQTPANKK
jgi:hypothetical protein